MSADITIIGGGLAGSEAALTLASKGYKVRLVECRPLSLTPAHLTGKYAELVCSNSLKSVDHLTAHGLLKKELELLGSHLLECAKLTQVSAGSALAVDREKFSSLVTQRIENNDKIERVNELAGEPSCGYTIIATGPLTMPPLSNWLKKLGTMHFYDAEAPIVSFDSIDMESAYFASRYGKGDGKDYLNCPLSKDEYLEFVKELNSAETAVKRSFEKKEIFEGCMPVEVMAGRGLDSLRFGPLKPVGLTNPKTGKRDYAVVQLRKENAAGDMYNIVGFQTNLKYNEQKRVFGLIPALKNAEYYRYGVMHRNTYIDSPSSLDQFFRLKNNEKVFIAGQLSGVEGYVESIASGKMAALHAIRVLEGKAPVPLPLETIMGALARYISTESSNFQPMNANYGLLPPLGEDIRDKSLKKEKIYARSINSMTKYMESILWN